MVRVRFVQTTPSSNPDFPFQPGQIIQLPKMTAEIRTWLKQGFAELLPADAPEAAVVSAADEQAVEPNAKGRG